MDLSANKQQTPTYTGPRTKATVAFHNRKSLFVAHELCGGGENADL